MKPRKRTAREADLLQLRAAGQKADDELRAALVTAFTCSGDQLVALGKVVAFVARGTRRAR